MDNTGAVLDFTLALFDCSNFNDVTKTKNGIFFFLVKIVVLILFIS